MPGKRPSGHLELPRRRDSSGSQCPAERLQPTMGKLVGQASEDLVDLLDYVAAFGVLRCSKGLNSPKKSAR
jgi:hypothetical protein